MTTPANVPKGPNRQLLSIAVGVSAVVLIAAAGAFYYASRVAEAKRQPHSDEITVNILPDSCEPNSLTVPAGKASFRIVNRSERAVEWEILDGVMVVEERENIAPGLSQVINATLQPGTFSITCGLLSNPHGTLLVTPTAASQAADKAKPGLVSIIGPLSEYRVYLNSQSRELHQGIADLQTAIAAGDLAKAQSLYAPARAAYQRIAGTAQRFAELDNRIAARADYFKKHEQDPAFTGFHRIEYGLFLQHSTDGLEPVVAQLSADADELKKQLLAQSLPPEQLTGNVARNLHNLAEQRTAGEEERYSHTDLSGFAANLEGARKVIDLLRPLLAKNNSDLLQRLDTASAAFAASLQAQREGSGYKGYDQVDASTRKTLADQAKNLGDAVEAIDPALGLSGR